MRVNALRFLVGAALTSALLLPFDVSSQNPPGGIIGRVNPPIPVSPVYDTSAFAALRWREIGPFRGGRSVAVAGSSKRPNEYYFGTTGGGVFKTTDGGITWASVTDKYFGGTIGAIGISESNPDIVYVGGGEYPIRGNVSHGDGVWRTTDAGKTWVSLGLADTRQISRVRVHPTSPDIAYVGAQGHVFGPNAERGVYKTTDGGKSWRKILYRNDSTGVTDLVMDAKVPETLYAAFWQA
ncbi:MAG TPA: glycosyl hydrolase, partial [Gemmatimonadaceae bacterium]|nr:glycosyl hydrolase [Gemmatimonadaceae bacterium]